MAATTTTNLNSSASRPRFERKFELLSPEYEVLDPTPDLHVLFAEFNDMFFDGKLAGCEVKWSPRMTLCAGLCSFQPRSGFCSIRLSEPLLKLRPRSDLINTLLHEMIHAYVFVFSPMKDHDDHGAVFQAHMRRINETAGTRITVFHTFHDEVDAYRQHWWKCDGPCQRTPPYYGVVKRAMNRPPGPTDPRWKDHEKQCGGSYAKVKDPPGFIEKQEKKRVAAEKRELKKRGAATPSVKDFFPAVRPLAGAAEKPASSKKKKEKKVAVPSDSKKPTAKKPRVGDAPVPPPTASSSRSVIATNDSTERATPPPGPPLHSNVELRVGLSDFPVVFAMDDGELFLAGDLHALFQQPVRALSRDAAGAKWVVDLTVSGDEEESHGRAERSSTQSQGAATGVELPEVIEIDD